MGAKAGAEVAQAYLSVPHGHGEPVRKLVGFAKITLDPGESREVELIVDPLDPTHPLSLWEAETHRWRTISGRYVVHVGTSSRNLPLRATFEVQSAMVVQTRSAAGIGHRYAS